MLFRVDARACPAPIANAAQAYGSMEFKLVRLGSATVPISYISKGWTGVDIQGCGRAWPR
jgi:hypothetical protein